jgi:hypothetical protein
MAQDFIQEEEQRELVPESFLQTATWSGPGYQPVVDYASWRTALMNFHPKYHPDKLRVMEAHLDTDEVFVLLQGQCILFFGEANAQEPIQQVYAQNMLPGIVYNVRKGAFHTHALSEDAVVLVVENRDTGDHNTDFRPIGEQGLRMLEALAHPMS